MISNHSFNKYLLHFYHIHSSVLCAENIALKKTDINPHHGGTHNEEGNNITDLDKSHVEKKLVENRIYGTISILLHVKKAKGLFYQLAFAA